MLNNDIINSQFAFHQNAHTYDRYASMQKHTHQCIINLMRPHITPHTQGLDLGCGTGQNTENLQSLHPKKLYAIDQSQASIAIAQSRSESIQWQWGNIIDTPLPTSHWIHANMVLHWLPSMAIENIAECLHHQGYLGCSIPIAPSLSELHQASSNTFVFYTANRWHDLFKKNGLWTMKHTILPYTIAFKSPRLALHYFHHTGTQTPSKKSHRQGLYGKGYLEKITNNIHHQGAYTLKFYIGIWLLKKGNKPCVL